MESLSEASRVIAAFAAGLSVTLLAAPVAAELARRTGFYDRPGGYKKHHRPTPYLGGAAVMVAFVVASFAFADELSGFRLPLVCAVGLCAVGTIDDRVGLGIMPRLFVEVAVGVVLWEAGQGWAVASADWVNLALTVVWVVSLINAFNLMDNLDGAAGTVATVSAVGTGALSLVEGDPMLAAICFSLAGACAGFLPFNLAKPSRIFLGDGGSMPIGFLLAAAIMVVPRPNADWTVVVSSALVVGLPLVDSATVTISRFRRGVGIFTGGRDHMTHRLLLHLGSERHVAGVLALGQAAMCAIAVTLSGTENAAVVAIAATLTMFATVAARTAIDPLARLAGRWR